MTFDQMVQRLCEDSIQSIQEGLGRGSAGDFSKYSNMVGRIEAYKHVAQYIIDWRKKGDEEDD